MLYDLYSVQFEILILKGNAPMALSKITLTLGKGKTKQKISLTPDQFEELKQDMRDLDKSHNYYWNHNPWYQRWYSQPYFTLTGNSGVSGTVTTSASTANINAVSSITTAGYDSNNDMRYLASEKVDPNPPSFKGKILSAT